MDKLLYFRQLILTGSIKAVNFLTGLATIKFSRKALQPIVSWLVVGSLGRLKLLDL